MNLDVQVPATYPDNCRIVFVGEAAGKEEADAKQGWVGPAGRCLEKACNLAGIDFRSIGRSNVVKRRPPDNKFRECFYETSQEPIYTPTGKLSKKTKKVERKTQELVEWETALAEELIQQQPNLVVACGNQALDAIVGHQGITDYRGSVLGSRFERSPGTPFKVLAVEHPSYIIRGNTRDFWILAHDLKKAKREMEFPEVRRELYESWSDPEHSLDHILFQLQLLQKEPSTLWTLDVETRAGTLACFAIGYKTEVGRIRAFCVPIQTTSGPYWSPEDELKIWRALHETLKSNSFLCNQNIEYDIYYLLRYGCEPSGVWQDTMLAHSILYPEFPKGLDFLCSWYLEDVVYYKGEGRNWNAGDRDPQLWEYCCQDAVYTLRVVEKIDEELKQRGLWEAYHGRL